MRLRHFGCFYALNFSAINCILKVCVLFHSKFSEFVQLICDLVLALLAVVNVLGTPSVLNRFLCNC